MGRQLGMVWITGITLLAAAITTVNGGDCDYTPWADTIQTCPDGRNEVMVEFNGSSYSSRCCIPNTPTETLAKRRAPICRATNCLTSSSDDTCTSLNKRIINGKTLEYEEVVREPCKKGGSSGEIGICCQPNSTETELLSQLGAERFEFPHMVKIKPIDCGGTVYNSRFILTASHCVIKGGELIDDELYVIVGTNIGDMDEKSEGNVYKVKKITPHEEYSKWKKNPNNELGKPRGRRTFNDVALLELEEDIKFTDHIKSLEIAPPDFDPFKHGDHAVIIGWGTTQTLALSVNLQKANFVLRQDERCFAEYDGVWRQLTGFGSQLLCVGGILDGINDLMAGEGDSGGPAVCRKANGHPVLCGVTSFAADDEKCAKNQDESSCKPSVYAEVAYFHSWINRIAGPQDSSTFYQPYLFGKDVNFRQHAHQVHITSANGKSCGGTLVRPDVVVTAAQCIMKGDGSKELYSDLEITTGVDDLKNIQGKRKFTVKSAAYLGGFKLNGDPQQNYGKILTDNLYTNDLAVVKLNEETDVDQSQLPTLPKRGETFDEGVELALPRNTTKSGKMRSREFKILDKTECEKRAKRLAHIKELQSPLDAGMLCGVEKYSGGSICDRELGGGLICKGNVLCGVQAYRTCSLQIPNGFIDVAKNARWIEAQI